MLAVRQRFTPFLPACLLNVLFLIVPNACAIETDRSGQLITVHDSKAASASDYCPSDEAWAKYPSQGRLIK